MSIVTDSGTQTAVVGTEHTLATKTIAGTWELLVDTGQMIDGDELELRAKTSILSGGTVRESDIGHYAHVQGQPIKRCIPLYSDQEVTFTLKQIAGLPKDFDWKVVNLEG